MTAYVVKRPTGVGVLSRGKDYSVKDLGGSQAGYTNLLKKELGVSLLADAPQTRWTQIHELSHVRHSLWSPTRLVSYILKTTGRKLDPTCVLAAEDARINEIALRRVPDAHKGFRLADETGAGIRRDIGGYVASHASPRVLADTIRPACDPGHVAAVDAWLAKLPRMAERELSVLRVTVPLALLLDELQRGPKPEPKPAPAPRAEEDSEDDDSEDSGSAAGEDDDAEEEDADGREDDGAKPADGTDSDGDGGADAPESESESESESDDSADDDGSEDAGAKPADDDDSASEEDSDSPTDSTDAADDSETDDGADSTGDDRDADAAAAEDEAALGEPDADTHEHACGSPLPTSAGATEACWLIPEVLEPPLTVPLRGGNAMVTTAETGTSLRWTSLHRIATDGVVFRHVRRRPGALQRGTVLIDVSGSMAFEDKDLEAIIAAMPYATVAVYSGIPCHRATVVVVARNGRRVASVARYSLGGNTCDGPALLWLSRQASPRLWVCDGVVTRHNDGYSPDLAKQCAAIMESAGILQVVKVDGSVRVTRKLVDREEYGKAPQAAELLAAVRDLERGRVRQ